MKSFLRSKLLIAQAMVLQAMVLLFPLIAGAEGRQPTLDARKGALEQLSEIHRQYLPQELQAQACELLLTASGSASKASTAPTVSKISYGADNREFSFTQVFHAKAGEGWRDPSGVVWYDRADLIMNQIEAAKYCADLGLRLPAIQEFQRLFLYMGATRDETGRYYCEGFRPQVLPQLEGFWFWSSSIGDTWIYSGFADAVHGGTCEKLFFSREYRYYSVRCVEQR